MDKAQVRLTQVYRINGRLTIADSIETAIATWCQWYNTTSSEISSIERVCNDSRSGVGNDAIVVVESLCGDFLTNQFTEDINHLTEQREQLLEDLKNCQARCDELAKRNTELSAMPLIDKRSATQD